MVLDKPKTLIFRESDNTLFMGSEIAINLIQFNPTENDKFKYFIYRISTI